MRPFAREGVGKGAADMARAAACLRLATADMGVPAAAVVVETGWEAETPLLSPFCFVVEGGSADGERDAILAEAARVILAGVEVPLVAGGARSCGFCC